MSEEKHATISINLAEGSVTIEGSESFIDKNLTNLLSFLETNKQYSLSTIKNTISSLPISDTTPAPIQQQQVTDKYLQAGIYSIDPESKEIHITAKIEGSTKAEKSRNLALIALYARGEAISSSELKDLCRKHACLDASNFAATFKTDMEHFVKKGRGQKWQLELTIPGKEEAKKLLEKLCNDQK